MDYVKPDALTVLPESGHWLAIRDCPDGGQGCFGVYK